MKTRIVSTLVIFVALVTVAAAGETGHPFRAKRFTFEFASPFDPDEGPGPEAKLVLQARPDSHGRYSADLHHTPISSLEITVGKSRLVVPEPLLRDVGQADLLSMDFRWHGENTNLLIFHYGTSDSASKELMVWWKDGKLIKIMIDRSPFNEAYRKYVTPEKTQ